MSDDITLSKVGPTTLTMPDACSSPGFTAMLRADASVTVQNSPPCAHHADLARARELLRAAMNALNDVTAPGCATGSARMKAHNKCTGVAIDIVDFLNGEDAPACGRSWEALGAVHRCDLPAGHGGFCRHEGQVRGTPATVRY